MPSPTSVENPKGLPPILKSEIKLQLALTTALAVITTIVVFGRLYIRRFYIGKLKYDYVLIILYYTCVYLTKLSILCLYLRLCKRENKLRYLSSGWLLRALTWLTLVFITLMFIPCVLVSICRCIPLSTVWSVRSDAKDGGCINRIVFFLSTSVLHIFAGIVIAILPIPLVLKIRGPLIYRISLLGVLMLGLLATIACGELKKLGKSEGINGTVSIAFYKNLAIVAAYTGHSIQTFDTTETGDISQARDTFTYFLEAPGPNKERQESSHPHQVVVDPTGHYVVAPDLGADLLRLYSINGSRLSELQNITVAAGSGPRHVAFHVIDKPNEIFERNRTMIYVVNELKNTLTVFKTRQWDNGTFVFHEVQNVPTLPPTSTEHLASVPSPTAGEIVISKDKRFLYVSNRNDYSFKDKKFGSSDSIALYKIDPLTGFVSFVKLLQAGGVTPRHFSFDQSGKFVAVALQETDTIVIYKVDPTSGEFIDAEDHDISLHVSDRPVCVNWL
ncbi:hypothetical protein TWF679_007800 [Orbilia oligospora]|uniref:Rhodopsin domain-containing protein n=1 Tax=Orbilia oligospora TaxID=2813651 RepID=A0A8H8V677_ORBOL|nr:hypothetical protein TWF679_007800 [Orbilia oligospora]